MRFSFRQAEVWQAAPVPTVVRSGFSIATRLGATPIFSIIEAAGSLDRHPVIYPLGAAPQKHFDASQVQINM
jgi:hypothetical protein